MAQNAGVETAGPLNCGQLILHIGRHKTGTSSLQHFFSNNAQALRTIGVIYPRAMRSHVAHHDLAYLCSPKRYGRLTDDERAALRAEYERLKAEVADARCVLLSSEAFQNASAEQAALTVGVSATVVVYLREQFEYLVSAYGQAVKNQKLAVSLEDYEKKVFRADYSEFLSRWQSAFPKGKLIVRLFAKDELVASDIRNDFCDAIGLSEALRVCAFSPDDENVSINGTLLEFKRRLNSTRFESTVSPRKLYRVLQKAAITRPDLNRGTHVSPAFASNVRVKYRESNASVCARYFPGRKNLFEFSSPRTAREADEVLSFDDVAMVINEIDRSDLGNRLLRMVTSA